jgi:mRNA interferase RelE/StbE
MSYQVDWTRRASRALAGLSRVDPERARQIRVRVRQFAAEESGDIRKLRGTADQYRLRVGTWRVIFALDGEQRRMTILQVTPRRDAYR